MHGQPAAGSHVPAYTRGAGFSLVELVIVIAIIGILAALLFPMLAKARVRSVSLKCRSNLRQNHVFLSMYATANRGAPYPFGWGTNVPPEKRWPVYVFTPPIWNPPTMRCPADLDQQGISYVVNGYLEELNIRLDQVPRTRRGSTEIIFMGEKKSEMDDCCLSRGEFERVADLHRHGLAEGSNYLYLDGHVDGRMPRTLPGTFDPWDPGGAP